MPSGVHQGERLQERLGGNNTTHLTGGSTTLGWQQSDGTHRLAPSLRVRKREEHRGGRDNRQSHRQCSGVKGAAGMENEMLGKRRADKIRRERRWGRAGGRTLVDEQPGSRRAAPGHCIKGGVFRLKHGQKRSGVCWFPGGGEMGVQVTELSKAANARRRRRRRCRAGPAGGKVWAIFSHKRHGRPHPRQRGSLQIKTRGTEPPRQAQTRQRGRGAWALGDKRKMRGRRVLQAGPSSKNHAAHARVQAVGGTRAKGGKRVRPSVWE